MQFYLEANYLLRKIVLFAVSTSLKIADYRAVFPDNKISTKDSPYGFCFRGVFTQICMHVAETWPGETVSFVLEEGDPGQDGAKRMFGYTSFTTEQVTKLRALWPVGTFTTAAKGTFGALDVADMHAFSRWQECSKGSLNPELNYLTQHLFVSQFALDKEDLRLQKTNLLMKHKNSKIRIRDALAESERLIAAAEARRSKGRTS
jgi:hypothetical protein